MAAFNERRRSHQSAECLELVGCGLAGLEWPCVQSGHLPQLIEAKLNAEPATRLTLNIDTATLLLTVVSPLWVTTALLAAGR